MMKLSYAIMKPEDITIAKCVHKTDISRVTQGNKAADEAAKAVTGVTKLGKVLLVTHEVESKDKITNNYGWIEVPLKILLVFGEITEA